MAYTQENIINATEMGREGEREREKEEKQRESEMGRERERERKRGSYHELPSSKDSRQQHQNYQHFSYYRHNRPTAPLNFANTKITITKSISHIATINLHVQHHHQLYIRWSGGKLPV